MSKSWLEEHIEAVAAKNGGGFGGAIMGANQADGILALAAELEKKWFAADIYETGENYTTGKRIEKVVRLSDILKLVGKE